MSTMSRKEFDMSNVLDYINEIRADAERETKKNQVNTSKVFKFDSSKMNKEECLKRLSLLREDTETKLSKAEDKLTEIEEKEPNGDGVKYDRWLEKYEEAGILTDYYQELLEEIEGTIASIEESGEV